MHEHCRPGSLLGPDLDLDLMRLIAGHEPAEGPPAPALEAGLHHGQRAVLHLRERSRGT